MYANLGYGIIIIIIIITVIISIKRFCHAYLDMLRTHKRRQYITMQKAVIVDCLNDSPEQ